MTRYAINVRQLTHSLSDALDLVGITHIHHGKRVAFMAAECGKRLGWAPAWLDTLYEAAILHDVGVSKTFVHSRLTQLAWDEEQSHCQAGAKLLLGCPPLAHLAEIVRHHHTHWNQLKTLGLSEAEKLAANCIYLVDRVDILTLASLRDQSNILLGREGTRQKVAGLGGDWFHPELVNAFLDISRSEAFWFSLESEHVNGYAGTWIAREQVRDVAFADLRALVHLFSVVIDAKSHFTREHSDGVARLARHLGEAFSLPERHCEELELAGLLHDLGKLRVPDELLEKSSRLTPAEFATIQRHSFDTYSILKAVDGLDQVALWASQHHERADGSGYPYHLSKAELTLEARIVGVADVFQALAQRRPYREPMALPEILAELRAQADAGRLDAQVVARVESAPERCWQVATQAPVSPV
jgi:HD-GYP domain-containing protein (c-di-GMP phosphodiesterase class II)